MSSYQVEHLLPYRCEQLFELAADVERYPEFLRWWHAARISRREADVYFADQTLGLGPIHTRFGSKAVLHRPERIDVTSDQAPFRHFQLSWIFVPEPGAGCQVTVMADIELRSPLLQRAFDLILPGTIDDIIVSFEARARELHRQ